jgi:hypothetical protein
MFIANRRKKGQPLIEYVVLFCVIIAAVLLIGNYVPAGGVMPETASARERFSAWGTPQWLLIQQKTEDEYHYRFNHFCRCFCRDIYFRLLSFSAGVRYIPEMER